MLQKDVKVIEAHARLLGNKDFGVHLDWLTENLQRQDEENRILDAAHVGMGQGRAQMLAEIIAEIQVAERDQDAIRGKRRGMGDSL